MYRSKKPLLLDLRVIARAFVDPPSHLGKQVGGLSPGKPRWGTSDLSAASGTVFCPAQQVRLETMLN